MHLIFIKDIKSFFKQWQCGECRRCFKHVGHLDKHVKTCNGSEIKHVWSGGVFEPKKNIKQSLADFGFDTSNHNFLFPYLAAYDTEASLPVATIQPAAKRTKMCADLNAVQVERVLKFLSTHQFA